jgi:hypothetical protein
VKRKFALLAVAIVTVAVAGFGLTGRSASAAPGLEPRPGGPYAALAGQAIPFDGSTSSGLGPLSYHWTFGDGTSATGARPVKAYGASGVYHVTLTVRDGFGVTAVAATTATIGGVRSALGCTTTLAGTLYCGTGVVGVSGVSGCVLTSAGWLCPRVAPSVVVPGVVVGGVGYPGSSSTLPNCALPHYTYTHYCHLLDQS